MAQLALQSSRFDYSVESVPALMTLPDGSHAATGFFVNRRTDTQDVLGMVTERYGIVQNAPLLEAAENAFVKGGLAGFTRRVIVTGQGQRLYAVYDFPTKSKKLASVGDELGLRLTVKNSFDGSLRASFVAGVLRLVCKNGLVTVSREVGMTQKHGSRVSVDFVGAALERAVESWSKSFVAFERLAAAALTQTQGHNILAHLAASNLLSGKLLEGVSSVWAAPLYAADGRRNLWSLYNAITQHLTHDVSGERFELAQRVSENTLAALDRASRDAARFAALVAAPVVDVEVVA